MEDHMSKRQSMAATGLVSNGDARIKLRDFIDVGSQSGPASGMFAPPFIGCVRRLMLAADKGHGKDKVTGINLHLIQVTHCTI
jgi:hypothetical protein